MWIIFPPNFSEALKTSLKLPLISQPLLEALETVGLRLVRKSQRNFLFKVVVGIKGSKELGSRGVTKLDKNMDGLVVDSDVTNVQGVIFPHNDNSPRSIISTALNLALEPKFISKARRASMSGL